MTDERPNSQWWIQSQGTRFGPYDRATMRRFVEEGRVAAETLVCPAGATEWRPATQVPWLQMALDTRLADPAARRGDGAPRVRYLVWAHFAASNGDRAEAVLRGMGSVAEIDPGVWALRTNLSVTSVRNGLAAVLGPGDRLLVVDSTHDRVGWFNLGPEVESRLKTLWSGPSRLPAND